MIMPAEVLATRLDIKKNQNKCDFSNARNFYAFSRFLILTLISLR
jgi:hypothetical protein